MYVYIMNKDLSERGIKENMENAMNRLVLSLRELDSFAVVHLEDAHIAWVEKNAYNSEQEYGDALFDRAEELLGYHKFIKGWIHDIEQRGVTLMSILENLWGADIGFEHDTKGERQIHVPLTDAMIRNSMLTLTKAKAKGIVKSGEVFKIKMPNGEVFETELLEVGNRLQERKRFRLFYKESNAEAGSTVHLREYKEGEWELTITNRGDLLSKLPGDCNSNPKPN